MTRLIRPKMDFATCDLEVLQYKQAGEQWRNPNGIRCYIKDKRSGLTFIVFKDVAWVANMVGVSTEIGPLLIPDDSNKLIAFAALNGVFDAD